MTIPIRPGLPGPIGGLQDRPRAIPLGPAPGEASFADVLQRVVADATTMQEGAQDAIGAFLRGEPVELHQVMAASEEAQLSLEMLVELRNKLTDAYRTVMNIQV